MAVLAFFLLGCQETQNQGNGAIRSDQNQSLAVQRETSKVRFQDSVSQGPSAVESAIELSKKYSALLEDLDSLRQENLRLTTENKNLKERIGPCETQLAQAQKELNEANDLLIEMRIELNNWKTNVLSFRDEMRQADQAQLEALLRILQVLGGEIEPAPGNVDETVTGTLNEPNQSGQSLLENRDGDDSNG